MTLSVASSTIADAAAPRSRRSGDRASCASGAGMLCPSATPAAPRLPPLGGCGTPAVGRAAFESALTAPIPEAFNRLVIGSRLCLIGIANPAPGLCCPPTIRPMRKTRVLVLAGGQSGEHEVSINSAKSVLQALPKDKFDVTSVVISQEGRWLPAPESQLALEHGSAASGGELVLHQAATAEGYDVVFPILHGPNGEDGTIQGMLKLAGIPCVGSSVLGSAVCMDKVMTKAVLASHGIPQVAYQLVTRSEFSGMPDVAVARLAALGLPVFV